MTNPAPFRRVIGLLASALIASGFIAAAAAPAYASTPAYAATPAVIVAQTV